jgi:hypothetical protein
VEVVVGVVAEGVEVEISKAVDVGVADDVVETGITDMHPDKTIVIRNWIIFFILFLSNSRILDMLHPV